MEKINLLILEDMSFDVAIMQKVMQRSGMDFEPTITTNKKEFIDAILRQKFDVILSDNSLPDFDATQAIKVMREHNIETPVILVTGTAPEDFAINMMKAGATDYILKDRLQRLPTAIANAIEKHRLEQEKKKHLDDLTRTATLLKESERLAHLGSWEMNFITNTTYWSDEHYRVIGYEPGEVEPCPDSFLSRVHHDDLERVTHHIKNAITKNINQKYSCRVINKDGSIRHVENEIFITLDKDDKAVRANGFSVDITNRKQVEESLSRSEANLRTVFDNARTGYALLDTAFNIISFNKALYNFSLEQLANPLETGKCATGFFSAQLQPVMSKALNEALIGISSTYYEVPYLQPDGSNKWYSTNWYPVTDNYKNVIGIIFAQTDITGRKTAELKEKIFTEDLIQRNAVLEQFAYIISHNLRGPVSTILGISELMQDNSVNDEERSYFVNGIAESVKKLDSVIIDLNTMIQSRNSDNENKETVYFSDILIDIKSGIQGVEDNGLPTIKSDFSEVNTMNTLKSYIHSIFYNLISNSIKYKRQAVPAVIEIKSKKVNNKIELTFKDNGMGIDLKTKGDQVFGLYKRFHVNAAEGRGMGLFMVKTQVETLGGKISLQSEVNSGTEFKIEFDA